MKRAVFLLGILFSITATAHADEPSTEASLIYSNTLSAQKIMTLGDECIDLLDKEVTSGWNVQLALKCNSQLAAVFELRKKDLTREQSNAELWASARLRTSMFIILNRLNSVEYRSIFVDKRTPQSAACLEIYWAYNHLRDIKRPYTPVTKSERKAFKKTIKPAFKACYDVKSPLSKADRYKITRDLGLLR